jgi:glycosyltransferase involved in cell wall biosynthesis
VIVDPKRVCFVGQSSTAVCYYRIMLPAMAIGADWCGVVGYPPRHQFVTGGVKGESQLPDLLDYDIVVVQQPQGDSWELTIKAMQAAGVKVVFEIDDYVHGIGDNKDHEHKKSYDKRALYLYERCMEACDALFCSTEYIARRYKKFNDKVYVCRNGIDLARYKLGKPRLSSTTIGWAGSTGHMGMMMPWLNQIGGIMQQKPEVNFMSIGMPFATALHEQFGEDRALALPWMAIEQYPAAMTTFDIALAPGGNGSWFKGKSDLRWLEASALGIPVIGRGSIYPEIQDGVTGFTAVGPMEMVEPLMALIGDADLRAKIGTAAKAHVIEHRRMEVAAEAWKEALDDVAAL